jgi:signal transduction histidine kinase
MKTAKKTAGYLMILLTFIIINLYAGTCLFYQLQEFKRQHMNIPIAIEVMENQPNPPKLVDALDVDDDGEDEVVYSHVYSFPKKQSISVFEHMYNDYHQDFYGDILADINYIFLDIYYKPGLETYVFRFLEAGKGVLFLREVDNRMNPVDNLEFAPLKKTFITSGNWFKDPVLVDLEADGNKELVLILDSQSPQDPRGAVCFDLETREPLWQYYSGTMIESAEFYDLNGDGKKEIILCSFAANYNIEENGTSDRYSYVIVLDSNGKELWKKEVGDWYTYARAVVSDLEDDGTVEIIAVAECHPARSGWPYGKVFCFKGKTGDEINNILASGVSYSKPFVLKSVKTGTRIYVGDSKGNLSILDRNFQTLKEIKRDTPLHVLNKSAATPSGNWEYIYVRTHNRLRVFDRDLDNEIFHREFDVERPIEMIPMKSKQGHYALVKADQLYRLKETKVSFNIKETVKHGVDSGLFFTIFILVLFNGFFVYWWVRTGTHLFPFLRKKKVEQVDGFQLYEIVRSIAHQVKNPISTILWTAEKIKRDSAKINETETRETYDQLADMLTADVKTLQRQTGHISRLVRVHNPVLKQTGLKTVLERIVEHYRTLADEDKQVNIRLTVNDIDVSIDEELFKEALVNIIDNAVISMPDGGELTISAGPVGLRLSGLFKHVLIEMKYRGHGADTKTGKNNGMGLSISRLIIEAHGGKIEVHSRKGFGTKIALIIPRGK